jgi:N-acetylmuramoyl-L-alanine amidase
LTISTLFHVRPRGVALVLGALAVFLSIAHPRSQAPAYTVYTADGQRPLPFRTSGNVDMVALDQVATLFGLTVAEDALVGGVTVRGRGQTILLIPGQSFASIGPGRIVSLPAPIARDRGAIQVPIDFLRVAVGPALGTRIDVRRPRHLVLVGDVRLPQVTSHFEPQGSGGRLLIDIQPATPHQVTRQANRLVVRFDAVAIDAAPATDLNRDFVTAVSVDGTSLVIDLGPSVATHRAEDRSPTQLHIDLLPAGAPPPAAVAEAPPARPAAVEAPSAAIDVGASGGLRTIVIDPGHGGDDQGATGAGGTKEKDYALNFARLLKSTIESRIGLRVLLTREGDENVPLDRRAALANNNKADLFISLHANASLRPAVSGLQVLSLRLDDYDRQTAAVQTTDLPVAVLGGGTRVIEVLPWDRAQIGFTGKSRVVADILRRHLTAVAVPMLATPNAELPLRPLVGANMPAILIELGFLSNVDDERALNGADRPVKIVNAILNTIAEIRQGVPTPPAGAQ